MASANSNPVPIELQVAQVRDQLEEVKVSTLEIMQKIKEDIDKEQNEQKQMIRGFLDEQRLAISDFRKINKEFIEMHDTIRKLQLKDDELQKNFEDKQKKLQEIDARLAELQKLVASAR